MADKKTEKPATHKYIRGKTYDRVMMLFVLLAVIAVTTSNGGISIKNTTILDIDVEKIYAAISGDQCAVTNIRIKKG